MISYDFKIAEFERLAEEALKGIDDAVGRRLKTVGEKAVEVAKETGTYHDVTGNLRSSNGYRVKGKDLVLFNEAPYADDIEARGGVVLSKAALEAERMLNEAGDDDE